MSFLLNIPAFNDSSGSLSVIDNLLPFDIKRVFYIYGVTEQRGGHSHKKTRQALISVAGSCSIYVNNGVEKTTFLLSKPNQLLLLEPEDWHTMDFSKDCILLVLASEHYDKGDYVQEEPKND